MSLTRLLVLAGLFLISAKSFCQAKMVLNDNAYLVISDSAKLVIDNSDASALTTSGSGGNIVSEGEYNMVKWNIGSTAGTYTIPFTTTPVSQGGNGTKIPLKVTISGSGSSEGSLLLSTYQTSNSNTPYPSDVTNVYSPGTTTDNSLYTIDRFWIVDAGTYSTKPSATLTFTYTDSSNEIGGNNVISELNLEAEQFDASASSWITDDSSTVDATNNTVTTSLLSSSSFNRSWALADVNQVFPVKLLSFSGERKQENNNLKWVATNEANVAYYAVERSSNGTDFSQIGTVKAFSNNSGATSYGYTDSAATSATGAYEYRLRIVSSDGSYTYSRIIRLANTLSFSVKLYPNPLPVHQSLNVGIQSDNDNQHLAVQFFNNAGQQTNTGVITVNKGYQSFKFNVTNLKGGLHFIRLINKSTNEVIVKKFVVE